MALSLEKQFYDKSHIIIIKQLINLKFAGVKISLLPPWPLPILIWAAQKAYILFYYSSDPFSLLKEA